jgi:hypothetical protein
MHFDELRFQFKDADSIGGSCPAFYEVDGGAVFQGKTLDAATKAKLRDLAADEDAVFVPQNIVDRIRAGA